MNFEPLIDWLGEPVVLAAGGALIGLGFGALAQRSAFCLRSAVIEVAGGVLGPKTAIWLLAFSAAVLGTQVAIGIGLLDVAEARQLAMRGSLSGSIIGGLMFGAGMILARGCAARLLVLSATGNLRALVAGLILTVVAQASFRGILSPAREVLADLWTVDGGASRNLLTLLHGGTALGVLLGAVWLTVAFGLARRAQLRVRVGAAAIGVGLMISAGWLFTYALSQQSFSPIAVKSISFIGPSADTLMGLINTPMLPLGFDVGLIPGVFVGSLVASLFAGDWTLQGFHDGPSMRRYVIGATLMGFGGMLAGGCAVGAGVTGGSIFALTGWLALAAMWLAAVITHVLIDRKPAEAMPAVGATAVVQELASSRMMRYSAAWPSKPMPGRSESVIMPFSMRASSAKPPKSPNTPG